MLRYRPRRVGMGLGLWHGIISVEKYFKDKARVNSIWVVVQTSFTTAHTFHPAFHTSQHYERVQPRLKQ